MSRVDSLPDSFYHTAALVLLGLDLSALLFILAAELVIRPRFSTPSSSKCPPSNASSLRRPSTQDPRRSSYKFPCASKPCASVLLHTKLRMMTSVFYIAFCAAAVVIPTFFVVWKMDFTLTIYLTVLIGLIFVTTFLSEGLYMGGKGVWLPGADEVLFNLEVKTLEAVRRERKGEFTLPKCEWTAGTTTYNPSSGTSHPHNAAASAEGQENPEISATAKPDPTATTVEREANSSSSSDLESRTARKAGILRKAMRRIIFEEMYCVPYLILIVPFLAILAVRYAP